MVEPISDNAAQNTALPTLDWSMVVRISVIVRGAVPDQLADPIIENLHSKVMADLTLGGYAIDVQPIGVTFNFTEADGTAGEIQCDYRVLYRTSVTNLAS
ncbi:MAG: hypothetical protein ACO289_04410 [Prochlorococcaceae cyanobacterium]